jgi:TPR repeat protein
MKRLITSLVLAASLSLPGFSVAAESNADNSLTLNDGQAAFNQGNYQLAFSLWSRLATQGQSDAQVFVGLSYANGWGVDRNAKLASLWYKKAALNDNPSAQFLLGIYLISGKESDLPAGVMWLRRAAENGDDSAKRFMKKARTRGWFDNIPTREYKPKAGKIESVALTNPIR